MSVATINLAAPYQTLALSSPFDGLLVVQLNRPKVANALNTTMGDARSFARTVSLRRTHRCGRNNLLWWCGFKRT